ncbi:RsiV family protein, partial [Bacillus sp. EKM417B]
KHDDLFDQDVKKQEIILNNERPFFFTKNGIAVVFGQYDLGPYAAGIRDVFVPASVYQ